MAGFELVKWYADAVTGEGDAVILYSAELHWRGPAIHYTSLLTRSNGRPTASRFSLRAQPPPEIREGAVAWTSRAWKADGRWDDLGGGIREMLFESPGGSLEWECIAPRARAEFRIAGAGEFRGWGYVERLRLSLPPWRLPIRCLRWGRFVNETDALVWIDWSGAFNRRVVHSNGAPVAAETIGDREVVLADGAGVLALEPLATLREGALGATALSVLPDLDRLFPARILRVQERKWLSRAALRRPGRPDSYGMAIHEVVEWP